MGQTIFVCGSDLSNNILHSEADLHFLSLSLQNLNVVEEKSNILIYFPSRQDIFSDKQIQSHTFIQNDSLKNICLQKPQNLMFHKKKLMDTPRMQKNVCRVLFYINDPVTQLEQDILRKHVRYTW